MHSLIVYLQLQRLMTKLHAHVHFVGTVLTLRKTHLRGHLLKKAMDGEHEQSIINGDSNADMQDNEFTHKNYESFEHGMHAMVDKAFEYS